MTHDEFKAKFQIINQIADGRVRSFNALSASGAVVMAHFLDGEPDDAILSCLDTLDPERKSRVLKITDVDGTPVVVTKFILDFESLQHWLGMDDLPAAPATDAAPGAPDAEITDATPAAVVPEPAPPPLPAAPLPPPASEPGEFTRMFMSPAAAQGAAAPAEGSAPAAPPEPVTAPAAVSQPPAEPAPEQETEPRPEPAPTPGEFTRLFEATPLPAPPPTPVAPPAAPSLVPPPAAATPPSTPEAPPAEAPGEFTRLFQSPSAPAVPELPRQADAPAGPAARHSPPPAGQGAGEFTRMFQAPPEPAGGADDLAALKLPEPRRVDLPSASPSLPRLNPNSPAPTTPPTVTSGPPIAPPPAAAGPGEFTRMFSAPAPPVDPRSQPPAQLRAPSSGMAPDPGQIAYPAKGAGGYADKLQGAGTQPPRMAPVPGAPPIASPPAAHPGAGEYTRIISAATPTPRPAPAIPASPPEPPAAAPPPTKWPLIAGLILVLGVTVALILFFLLRAA